MTPDERRNLVASLCLLILGLAFVALVAFVAAQ